MQLPRSTDQCFESGVQIADRMLFSDSASGIKKPDRTRIDSSKNTAMS